MAFMECPRGITFSSPVVHDGNEISPSSRCHPSREEQEEIFQQINSGGKLMAEFYCDNLEEARAWKVRCESSNLLSTIHRLSRTHMVTRATQQGMLSERVPMETLASDYERFARDGNIWASEIRKFANLDLAELHNHITIESYYPIPI